MKSKEYFSCYKTIHEKSELRDVNKSNSIIDVKISCSES